MAGGRRGSSIRRSSELSGDLHGSKPTSSSRLTSDRDQESGIYHGSRVAHFTQYTKSMTTSNETRAESAAAEIRKEESRMVRGLRAMMGRSQRSAAFGAGELARMTQAEIYESFGLALNLSPDPDESDALTAVELANRTDHQATMIMMDVCALGARGLL